MFRDDDTYVDIASAFVPGAGGDGQLTLADADDHALAASSVPCSAVFVQADVANTTNMFIGLSLTKYTQFIPGQGVWIPIKDVSLIHVEMVSGTGKANYVYLA